jgi:hypothetical protein
MEGFDGALGSGETVSETDSTSAKIVDLNGDGWPGILVVRQIPGTDIVSQAQATYNSLFVHSQMLIDIRSDIVLEFRKDRNWTKLITLIYAVEQTGHERRSSLRKLLCAARGR